MSTELLNNSIISYNSIFFTDKIIGKGRLGDIVLVTTKYQQCSLKKLTNSSLLYTTHQSSSLHSHNNSLTQLSIELSKLQQLSHRNIISYHGVTLFPVNQTTQPTIGIISEYMDLSLDGVFTTYLMKDNFQLQFEDIIDILYSISCGLAYLHTHAYPIIHHDLTPRNILVSSSGKDVKISDYGLPSLLQSNEMTMQLYDESYTGTLVYSPPEYLKYKSDNKPIKHSQYGNIYSLGIILIQCINQGEYPKLDKRLNQYNNAIQTYPIIENLIKSMVLPSNPHDRPLADDIVKYCNDIKLQDKYYKSSLTSKGFLHKFDIEKAINQELSQHKLLYTQTQDQLHKQETKLSSEINHSFILLSKIKELEELLHQQNQQSNDLEHSLKSLLQSKDLELTTYQLDINKHKESYSELQNDNNRLQECIHNQNTQLSIYNETIQTLRQSISDMNIKLNTEFQVNNELKDENALYKHQLESLHSQHNELINVHSEMECRLEQILTRWKDEHNQCINLSNQLKDIEKRYVDIKSLNYSLTKELDIYKSQHHELLVNKSNEHDIYNEKQLMNQISEMDLKLRHEYDEMKGKILSQCRMDVMRYVNKLNIEKSKVIELENELKNITEGVNQRNEEHRMECDRLKNRICILEEQNNDLIGKQNVSIEQIQTPCIIIPNDNQDESVNESSSTDIQSSNNKESISKDFELIHNDNPTLMTISQVQDKDPTMAILLERILRIQNEYYTKYKSQLEIRRIEEYKQILDLQKNMDGGKLLNDSEAKLKIDITYSTKGCEGIIKLWQEYLLDENISWRASRLLHDVISPTTASTTLSEESKQVKYLCQIHRIEYSIMHTLEHYTSYMAISQSIRFIGVLAYQNNLMRRRIGEIGIICKIVEIMKGNVSVLQSYNRNRNDKDIKNITINEKKCKEAEQVINYSLTAIMNLCYNSLENKSRFHESLGVEVLINSIEANKGRLKNVIKIFQALYLLCDDMDICITVLECGGGSIIMNTMLEYRTDRTLQLISSNILRTLCSKDDDLKRKLRKLGATEVCRVVMDSNVSDIVLQNDMLTCIQTLSD